MWRKRAKAQWVLKQKTLVIMVPVCGEEDLTKKDRKKQPQIRRRTTGGGGRGGVRTENEDYTL